MNDDTEPADRRNVVLVTVDSLRADHCGYWGYDRPTTPTLDRLAEEGFVFEQAIAPGPSTYESMPAVFTGRHMTTFRANVRRNGATRDAATENGLDARLRTVRTNMNSRTIAEWFADRGYATGAFTTNPYTGTHTGFARGFDHYEDFMGEGEGPVMRKAAHLPVLSELKHVVTLARGDRASKPWADYYDRIVEWTRSVEEPYFLWVFLLDTHTPYLVDPEYRDGTNVGRLGMYYHNWRLWMAKKWRKSENHSSLDREPLVELYDAAVRAVDCFLSTLLEDVQATNPAVVIHSDHGEAFGEHGAYGHDAQLYEENLHVPLVVHGTPLSGRTTKPMSLVQLPTLLRSLATDADEFPEKIRSGPVLSKTFDAEQFSLRGPDWKYVCRVTPDDGTIRDDGMYNLSDDPGEHDPKEGPVRLVSSCRQAIRQRLDHERELDAVVDGVDEFVDDVPVLRSDQS